MWDLYSTSCESIPALAAAIGPPDLSWWDAYYDKQPPLGSASDPCRGRGRPRRARPRAPGHKSNSPPVVRAGIGRRGVMERSASIQVQVGSINRAYIYIYI